MRKIPNELPAAVGGVDGESDIVAARSGCNTPRTRRPVSADPPDALDEPEPEELVDEEEDIIRPDIGPTG